LGGFGLRKIPSPPLARDHPLRTLAMRGKEMRRELYVGTTDWPQMDANEHEYDPRGDSERSSSLMIELPKNM
jgi:hypothetical protein